MHIPFGTGSSDFHPQPLRQTDAKEFRHNLIRALPIIAIVAALHGGARAGDYYVSPIGDDGNPGTLEKPLRTIAAARERVRGQVAAGLAGDVRVHLRAGTYTLAEPLVFDERDSGTAEHSITYQAHGDEQAVISGGRRLDGAWQRHDGDLWRLDLPEGTWFRQLFIETGEGVITRCTRARWPNHGSRTSIVNLDNDNFIYDLKEPIPGGALAETDQAEFGVFTTWVSSRVRVKHAAGTRIETQTLPGSPHPATRPGKGSVAYLEHARAFIDQPGEWYLDRDGGHLWFMAGAGRDPNGLRFFADRLTTLVRVAGRADQPVVNLNFRKLAFRYSMWELPEIGFGDMWTGNYGTPAKGIDWVKQVPPAIECEYLRNCAFERCDIAHLGGTGIGFGRGAVGNRVVGCHVHDIGAIGINVGWRTNASTDDGWVPYDRTLMTDLARAWGGDPHVPRDNRVTDNRVHHCGQVYEGCAGIFLAFQRNFEISHNHVSGLPYGCIIHQHFGGRRERCVSAYNEVFDSMLLLGDGGGIYTSVTDCGAHIHHNFVHDIVRRPGAVAWGNVGIYLDEFGNNCLVEHNALANITDAAMKINRSKGHTIRDNAGLKGFSGGTQYLDAFGNSSRDLTDEELAQWHRATGPREPHRTHLAVPPSPFGIPEGALDRASWTATAFGSFADNTPGKALDGSSQTWWYSGAAQSPGQWFMVDMKAPRSFSGLTMKCKPGDHPRAYEIHVSNDGRGWGEPVAAGRGKPGTTEATFPRQTARFLKIVQTGETAEEWWTILELNVH